MTIYNLSIDPGSRDAGAALWALNGELIRTWALSGDGKDPATPARTLSDLLGGTNILNVVVEKPKHYSGHKASPQSLCTLALSAGAFAMVCPQAVLLWLTAPEWKMRCAKRVTTLRAKRLLTSQEIARVQNSEDVWDSVSLGLVAFGRATRGVRANA